jgi:hypothetical protein
MSDMEGSAEDFNPYSDATGADSIWGLWVTFGACIAAALIIGAIYSCRHEQPAELSEGLIAIRATQRHNDDAADEDEAEEDIAVFGRRPPLRLDSRV